MYRHFKAPMIFCVKAYTNESFHLYILWMRSIVAYIPFIESLGLESILAYAMRIKAGDYVATMVVQIS